MDELILKKREIENKIIEILENSQLPAFILKSIMQDFQNQLSMLEEQQYQEAFNRMTNINKENEVKEENNNGGEK